MNKWKQYKKSGSFSRSRLKYLRPRHSTASVDKKKEQLPSCSSSAHDYPAVNDLVNDSIGDTKDNEGEGEHVEDDDYFSPDEYADEYTYTSEAFFENYKDLSFLMFLRLWAVNFNIRQSALKVLIWKLNKTFDAQLPKDPRTLMGTISNVSESIINSCGGQYWHQGIEKCLRYCLSNLQNAVTVSININIDGLPIYNNGKQQFWPILFNIQEYPLIKPMIIGMFYGDCKPSRIEDYLQPFVDEMRSILEEGLLVNGHKVYVKLRAWICDSPARAFIKGKLN